jgi:integrase
VPLHPLLAEFMQEWKNATSYPEAGHWVFASFKLKGRQPRTANMLVEDHLRPAAVRAGVLKPGDKVRFGFHNLRHSLASFLVRSKTDPKTVQALLRHSDVKTTLQLYAHSVSADRGTAGRNARSHSANQQQAVNCREAVQNHGLTLGWRFFADSM